MMCFGIELETYACLVGPNSLSNIRSLTPLFLALGGVRKVRTIRVVLLSFVKYDFGVYCMYYSFGIRPRLDLYDL